MERHCCLIRRKHLAFCDYLYEYDVTLCGLNIAVSDFIVTQYELAITFCTFINTLCGFIIYLCWFNITLFVDFLIPSVDISFCYVIMAD